MFVRRKIPGKYEHLQIDENFRESKNNKISNTKQERVMKQKPLWILIITLILTANVFAQMKVKDTDANVLMQVTDEGTVGKMVIDAADMRVMEIDVLTMPSITAPSPTTNKLYNVGGSLYWSGTALGVGATNINGLSDGRAIGLSVYLCQGAGANDPADVVRYNVGVGVDALGGASTGSYNTACGCSALHSNTTGQYNTASGDQALYYNQTGDFNTAVGVDALVTNPHGAYNTAIGYNALGRLLGRQNNDYGNTAVGQGALSDLIWGNNCTAIGNDADVNVISI